mmetsp:Transcript_8912/g.21924  ORF Transcript_8912/g.21924 Transcript_8912/m.21924 type:complete len:1310 (-) Transcript_8912:413-4342(-)
MADEDGLDWKHFRGRGVGARPGPVTVRGDLDERKAEMNARLRDAKTIVDNKLYMDENGGDFSSSGNGEYLQGRIRNLKNVEAIPIPPGINQDYAEANCTHVFKGLFPEIMRAWITMDNVLYLWNYADGKTYKKFDELDEGTVIVSVGLVQPLEGTGSQESLHNNYMIVITTTVDIILLELRFEDDDLYKDAILLRTRFRVSLDVDSALMLKVVGTPNGRIFMGGKDGNVYELIYVRKRNIVARCFGSKCQKTNHGNHEGRLFYGSTPHYGGILRIVAPYLYGSVEKIKDLVIDADPSRQYLYSLHNDSTIAVYFLGRRGDSFQCMTYKTRTQLVKHLDDTVEGDWKTTKLTVISLHVVSPTESSDVMLVAVTNLGHRIYMHSDLEVQFVRYPPDSTALGVLFTDRAYYAGGTLILAGEKQGNLTQSRSIMRSIHDETWRDSNSGLVESVEFHELKSQIDCIAEVPEYSRMIGEAEVASFLYKKREKKPLKGLKPLAVQHVLHPRRFVVLTETNLLIYEKQRPLDIFAEMLTKGSVERLFDKEPEEMRAMCLALLGREDQPEMVRKNAKEEFYKPRAHSSAPSPPNSYSRTHAALNLYASRVLRPVWDWSVCKQKERPPGIRFRYLKKALENIERPIHRFYTFIEKHRRQIYRAAIHEYQGTHGNVNYPTETKEWKAEQKSLDGLSLLLEVSLECFTILKLACNPEMQDLVRNLSDETLTWLKSRAFSEVVTTKDGKQRLRELINALVVIRPDDAIIRSLQQKCKQLFDRRELKYVEAVNLTHTAVSRWTEPEERKKKLNDALKQYQYAATGTGFNISEACNSLKTVHYYSGVVTLALHRAALVRSEKVPIPTETTEDFFGVRPGLTEEASSAGWAMKEIETCHNCILEMFYVLLVRKLQPEKAGTVSLAGSKGPEIESHEKEQLVDEAVEQALTWTGDRKFSERLYNWFIKQELHTRLLTVESDVLQTYLKQSVDTAERRSGQDEKKETVHDKTLQTHAPVLRDYYMKYKMWKEAVDLLDTMAYSKSRVWTLKDRIHFLRDALVCAQKVIKSRRFEAQQGPELGPQINSDYIEALSNSRIPRAELQLQLQEALIFGSTNASEAEVLRDLDSKLFDINDLLSIANRRRLWENALAIIDFNNQPGQEHVVKSIWRNIINRRINKASEERRSWREEVIKTCPKQFVGKPLVFPTAYLAELLEEYNMKYEREPGNRRFVLDFFKELKVPLKEQIDAYHQLLEGRTREEQIVGTVIVLADEAMKQRSDELYLNTARLLALLRAAHIKARLNKMKEEEITKLASLKLEFQRRIDI